MIALLVGACGALGAVTRFLVDTGVRRVWPTTFPVATLLINVTGSFVLGVMTGAVSIQQAPDVVGVAAGVGFCGGYTTFSTAMVETVRLARERRAVLAGIHLIGQPALCIAAAALGVVSA